MVMPTDDEAIPSLDGPTGLPNRLSWWAVLEAEEQRCRRYGGDHGLVLIRLTGRVGDRIARMTADALGTTVRNVDFVAAIDRRTFAVLALHCEDLGALVDRLRWAFAAAGVHGATVGEGRLAGTDLRATWRAMTGEHSQPATVHYVDFVASTPPTAN
jgi:GGDEF domain-containing protein